MLTTHLHARAFFMPILNALVAFGLGYVLGLRGDPVFVGAVCAALVWLCDHTRWLGIVAMAYAPEPAPVAWIEEEEDIKTRGVACRANPETIHRIPDDCPMNWSDLCHWAIEMRQGRGLTYREWVGRGEDKFNTNEEYKKFLDWIVAMGWATGGLGEEAKLTQYGKCIVNDIVEGNFRTIEGGI